MSVSLVNARVLLEDGSVEKTEILIEDGIIQAIGTGAVTGRAFDLDDRLVLPGVIDLHGDGYERSLMPRTGTHFPIDIALVDADPALRRHPRVRDAVFERWAGNVELVEVG